MDVNLSIPILTAEAERMFNLMNQLRTSLTNSLEEKTLNTLMSLEYGEKQISDEVLFNEAISTWLNIHKQYYIQKIYN